MKAEFLAKTSLRDEKLCDRFCLFTVGGSMEDIKRIRSSTGGCNKKIICFGADRYSVLFINALRDAGIAPDIITDNGIRDRDVYLDGIPFIRPAVLLENKQDYYFIITLSDTKFVNQIRKQLLFHGVESFSILALCRVFDFDCSAHKGLSDAFFEVLGEIYADSDFSGDNFDHALTAVTQPLLWWSHVAEWVLTEYKDRKDISLLDVGPGIGLASLIYKRLLDFSIDWIALRDPISYHRVSQQKHLLERNKINVRYGYIEIEAFDGDYDLILFTEVIEHLLLNPVNTMRKLHAMLKPNGHLVLTTIKRGRGLSYYPNWRDLPLPGQLTLESYESNIKSNEAGHVYEYSQQEIEEVIEESGFHAIHTAVTSINMQYVCKKNV